MTGDYKVVLPLMIVCVISALVARGLWPETIYTQKLARRGLHLRAGNNVDLMASIPVEAVMTADVKTLDVNMPLAEAKEIMLENETISTVMAKMAEGDVGRSTP